MSLKVNFNNKKNRYFNFNKSKIKYKKIKIKKLTYKIFIKRYCSLNINHKNTSENKILIKPLYPILPRNISIKKEKTREIKIRFDKQKYLSSIQVNFASLYQFICVFGRKYER